MSFSTGANTALFENPFLAREEEASGPGDGNNTPRASIFEGSAPAQGENNSQDVARPEEMWEQSAPEVGEFWTMRVENNYPQMKQLLDGGRECGRLPRRRTALLGAERSLEGGKWHGHGWGGCRAPEVGGLSSPTARAALAGLCECAC